MEKENLRMGERRPDAHQMHAHIRSYENANICSHINAHIQNHTKTRIRNHIKTPKLILKPIN